ncbi:hypothetical protein B0T26DRAFT_464602 [Lasiosphaeria miniovina]|uniref:Secreted protein n=1 Tax=Lasiosphaeria miniovina TaxID=1954250 RepID=A0AA40A048_9PEZI|nr:uncharacterized protein B0T26DRAFT_464602 [Lasiosphaeria miniovina]KAK0706629.1 hypothetical protein B0T26DRAFT_464602 [Lasiosphaeria miniovina]
MHSSALLWYSLLHCAVSSRNLTCFLPWPSMAVCLTVIGCIAAEGGRWVSDGVLSHYSLAFSTGSKRRGREREICKEAWCFLFSFLDPCGLWPSYLSRSLLQLLCIIHVSGSTATQRFRTAGRCGVAMA